MRFDDTTGLPGSRLTMRARGVFGLLRRSKTSGPDGNDVYPKIQISEVYTLGKSLNNINSCLSQPVKKQYFDIKEVRDQIIQQYIKENELEGENVKRGHVSIDP